MPTIIKPSMKFITATPNILDVIEHAARQCYQSEPKYDVDLIAFFNDPGDCGYDVIRNFLNQREYIIKGQDEFIRRIIAMGHESVLEHASVTVDVICDRGVTHEIVRHRIAAYSQESTRYCNYFKGEEDSQITFIDVMFFNPDEERVPVIPPGARNPDPENPSITVPLNKYEIWQIAMSNAEWAYMTLMQMGATPQEARSVLPNSTKTAITITFNMREWRHFFRLRTSPKVHPQMRQWAIPTFKTFRTLWPCLFDDIKLAEEQQ